MNRPVIATVALLFCSVTLSSAFDQVKAVAPTAAPAPAATAKWVAPVKGIATVEVMQGPTKVVGKEIVTPLKLKNTSTGSINLLKVDQMWYDRKRTLISSTTGLHRKPFLPGEIIEMELKAPLNGQPDVNQMTFAHANGKVNASKVKKF